LKIDGQEAHDAFIKDTEYAILKDRVLHADFFEPDADEKLIAKLILASSKKGSLVFDPFLGSGTTAVVAKKLERRYCGIEINEDYCLLALKRLARAERDTSIQGYTDGVFWERNTGREQGELREKR